MKLKIWGCRGSIPTPGKDTVRYGGNTPCVELKLDDNNLIILDSGTGIKNLGNYLIHKGESTKAYIIITHPHWDHIQGFPFFNNFFFPFKNLIISFPFTLLIIAYIDYGFIVKRYPISKCKAGMIYINCLNRGVVNFKFFLTDLQKFYCCFQLAQSNGEINPVHLICDNLLKCL
ncbi:Metallo-beta-lactamase superfamily protein [Candidatus Kryptobacter tengchongensis]|uniref:Metallo-beta-lactamase superfamily protein n=1 Tax=Kryptobacter tengchongensis TaxID=1643429 RepID=A0A656DAY0_KRYT1|nr:Metallo-beta-lactamase superfamily protein [Candidatus Kryptobacter tengchongensis]